MATIISKKECSATFPRRSAYQQMYNLLFRWFVGMEMDEVVWNHAVYSKNRERLLNEEIAESFFKRVLERAKPYVSDEHFTVDGTMIEAWASHKSFRPKDGSGKPPGAGGDVDFRGEKRKNQTQEGDRDAGKLSRIRIPQRHRCLDTGSGSRMADRRHPLRARDSLYGDRDLTHKSKTS